MDLDANSRPLDVVDVVTPALEERPVAVSE